jgi:hypothetical protein
VPTPRSARALLLAVVFAAGLGCGCRNVLPTTDEAAAALRATTAFTQRPGSPVGRELVDVLSVRRLSRQSAEVEFTWRDTAVPAGSPPPPLRTSMALFRRLRNGTWALEVLYKVD